MLAETPVTQRSPRYSAVSSSLTNPLPDCFNYSPFCHTHYLTLRPDQYFTSLVPRPRYFTSLFMPDQLPSRSAGEYSHCCSALLLQNLVRNSCLRTEYRSALRKLNNKQRQVVMFLLLLFKYSSQLSFVSFSFLSISILSLLPLSSPFPHFP